MTHAIGPFTEPLQISVVDGEVVLHGPDGIAGSFTPEAAAESAERLLAAAEDARRAAAGQPVRGIAD